MEELNVQAFEAEELERRLEMQVMVASLDCDACSQTTCDVQLLLG